MQERQSEWHDQWSMLQDHELGLFLDWIFPVTLDDLRGKTVLEGGCGGGQHTVFMASYAKEVVAVDLNTVDIARERTKRLNNIRLIESDLATMTLNERFDVVLSVGVVHHTDDPEATVRNLVVHLKNGGRLILWVYSAEGNGLVRWVVEPLRKLFLRYLPRKQLLPLSRILTTLTAIPVYTLYRLPLPFLPYYEYFENFRRLSFERNVLNIFDKLNAPQVQFITKERVLKWRSFGSFMSYEVSAYRGVSWRVSAVLST